MTEKYTVNAGDTLWSIAKEKLGRCDKYIEIVRLNGLKTSALQAGTVILLPRI